MIKKEIFELMNNKLGLRNTIVVVFIIAFVGLSKYSEAHPHVFIDAKIQVHFDKSGLSGFNVSWTFDNMFSELMIDEFDTDFDDQLSKEEQKVIYQKAFVNLKKFGYFTEIVIDNKTFEIKYVANFSAKIDNGILSYSFFIPCHSSIQSSDKKIEVYTYDNSYYMDVSLTSSSVSFSNSTPYQINSEVVEDETKRYYFEQIAPLVLRMKIHRKL